MERDTQSAYLPTLMSSYRATERYNNLLFKACSGKLEPSVNLSALDAYLLQQVVNQLSNQVTIVDLAADATCGASTICWLSAANVRQAVVPQNDWETGENAEWRTGFRFVAEEMGFDDEVLLSETIEQALKAKNNPLSQVIITLAQTEADAPKLGERLRSLFALQPNAAVFLLPLGAIGDSELLAQAINFGSSQKSYRVVALRDFCPFWTASRLGLIYPVNNADLPVSLDRLQQQYDGNFQFLNLTQMLIESELHSFEVLERERQAFLALQSSISLKHELKRWLWRKFPSPIKRLIQKLRRRPA